MIEDIRDIRAPLPIPAWWHWPLAIALAALGAFAVVLLVRWWQRRRAARLSPLERARQALVAAETHARAGRSHEWADIVAETVRASLAARMGVGVLPQTTTELATAPWARLAKSGEKDAPPGGPSLAEGPRLIALLGQCDLARFAKASLDVDALLAETAVARELVESLHSASPGAPTPTATLASVTS
jgi:hypothetical protein